MARQIFSNNAVSLLAAPISASATSLSVVAGTGSLFPVVGVDEYFLVTLENQAGTAREIIRIVGRSGDTLTIGARGLEGTTAQAWAASLGNDTLVDHRLTAGTIAELAIDTIQLQSNSTPLGAAETLNFSTDFTITGSGPTKTIELAAAGSSWVQGENTSAPSIAPTATDVVSHATYSNFNRGFKFFVTVVDLVDGRSASLEILANISGLLPSNAEDAEWNITGRVGQLLNITAGITLNTTTKLLELFVTNNEPNPIQVMCTRIQHAA